MHITGLAKDGIRRELRTDDRGTSLLDDVGYVMAEHGTDRHAALLEEHLAAGWRVERDQHRAPGAARAASPDLTADRGGGPTATVRDGEAG